MEEEKNDVEQQEEIAIQKKPSMIVRILLLVVTLLSGIIVMIVVSNLVFNMRSKSVKEIQASIWAPSISAKTEPLKTYLLSPMQLNLNDPTGKNPVFLKITMALAFHSDKNVKFDNELASRKFEIRDKVIRIIASKFFEDINTPDKQLALKKEIVNQVNSILINGVINEVYISEFNVMVSK